MYVLNEWLRFHVIWAKIICKILQLSVDFSSTNLPAWRQNFTLTSRINMHKIVLSRVEVKEYASEASDTGSSPTAATFETFSTILVFQIFTKTFYKLKNSKFDLWFYSSRKPTLVVTFFKITNNCLHFSPTLFPVIFYSMKVPTVYNKHGQKFKKNQKVPSTKLLRRCEFFLPKFAISPTHVWNISKPKLFRNTRGSPHELPVTRKVFDIFSVIPSCGSSKNSRPTNCQRKKISEPTITFHRQRRIRTKIVISLLIKFFDTRNTKALPNECFWYCETKNYKCRNTSLTHKIYW